MHLRPHLRQERLSVQRRQGKVKHYEVRRAVIKAVECGEPVVSFPNDESGRQQRRAIKLPEIPVILNDEDSRSSASLATLATI